MGEVLFTADTHFFSKNIITYCSRPYASVEEMDEALISNWNNKVGKNDLIYMLGDMIWGHQNYYKYMSRLNGQKHLILGNHDNKQCYKKLMIDKVIQSISQTKSICIDGQKIFMSHYPHRSWNHAYHGGWALYGHVHNTLPDYGKSTDVGVDKWNYTPVSFSELKEYFKDKDSVAIPSIRDDYSIVKTSFDDHFTSKYIERINGEAEHLDKLLDF